MYHNLPWSRSVAQVREETRKVVMQFVFVAWCITSRQEASSQKVNAEEPERNPDFLPVMLHVAHIPDCNVEWK